MTLQELMNLYDSLVLEQYQLLDIGDMDDMQNVLNEEETLWVSKYRCKSGLETSIDVKTGEIKTI